MNNFILGFKFALSYFTILPVKFKENDDLSKKEILSFMLFSLPLLGLVLGFITLVLYHFLADFSWFGAIICAVSYMVLYGFIHTEAIIDVADAIYAKHSGKDAYEVIKEPTIGAMGVLYAFAFFVLKIAGIAYLFLNGYLLEFVSIIVISRLMLLFVIKNFEFKSSFVNQLKDSLSTNIFLSALIIFTLASIVLIGFKAITLTIFAFIFSCLIAIFIKKNVGFLNGDALGTILELNELFLIITLLFYI
ncbi:MAG: adenosylcobinamide-GDP ribazoletransferase [Arcobacter sp.]|uniref:adenosylcobinamide-GDP ribazoletransferase n=1 Tax=Arcobacter sp. TaxID=1872629 RepID=UPI003C716CA6